MDLTTLLPPDQIDPADHPALLALARLADGLYACEAHWDEAPNWHENLHDLARNALVHLILPNPRKSHVRSALRGLMLRFEPPRGEFPAYAERGSNDVVDLHALWLAALNAIPKNEVEND